MPANSMATKPSMAPKMMFSAPKSSNMSRTSGGISAPESTIHSIMPRCSGAVAMLIGMDTAT